MNNGKDEEKTLFLYTDGASRGNPGPSHGLTLFWMKKGNFPSRKRQAVSVSGRTTETNIMALSRGFGLP